MSTVVSKHGVHCIGGTRNGYGEFCATIAAADRRLALVKVRDDLGAVDEPLKYWPDVLCIGAFTEFDRLPFDFAKFSARAKLKPQIKVWEVLNEDDSPATYATKADLYIALAPQFTANGWTLCMFSCSSGTPPYPEEDGGVSYREIARACKWMKYNGYHAFLALHEYISSGGTIGRWKRLADYLEQQDALIPIVITEAGYETFQGDAEFMQAVINTEAVYADPRVVGTAQWTLGGGGWAGSNYQTALPEFGEYIATVAPIAPPPPADKREFVEWRDAETGATISTLNPYPHKVTRSVHAIAITRPKVPPIELLEEILETDGHGSVIGGGIYPADADSVWEWKP